jgi:hypothetical protein
LAAQFGPTLYSNIYDGRIIAEKRDENDLGEYWKPILRAHVQINRREDDLGFEIHTCVRNVTTSANGEAAEGTRDLEAERALQNHLNALLGPTKRAGPGPAAIRLELSAKTIA